MLENAKKLYNSYSLPPPILVICLELFKEFKPACPTIKSEFSDFFVSMSSIFSLISAK